MVTNKELSCGLSRLGERVPAICEGMSASGFTYPATAREYVSRFANSEDEKFFLGQYWVELAREQLARAPFYAEVNSASPPIEFEGQAFRSTFLDGTWARMRVVEVALNMSRPLNVPREPPLLRFAYDPNDVRQDHERFRQLKDASLPQALRDNAGKVWWEIFPSSLRHKLVAEQIRLAMTEHGVESKPRRSFTRFPVFHLVNILEDLELIAYIEAQGNQITMGQLDLQFAVIPRNGKFDPNKMSIPYRAHFLPETLVPFFRTLQFFRSTGELTWSCSAIATLCALVRTYASDAFTVL